MKTKIVISLFIIFLIFTSVSSGYLLYKERKTTTRLSTDIKNGYAKGFEITEYYKAKNGQIVAKNAVLEFTNREIKNNIAPEIVKQLENLGIKPKQITNYSETVIKSEKEIFTKMRDTLIYDTVKAQYFHYIDDFYVIDGIQVDNKQKLNIKSYDSIIQVIYKGARYSKQGRRLPGFCFWRPRSFEQVITSKNPSSKITYCKTISISK